MFKGVTDGLVGLVIDILEPESVGAVPELREFDRDGGCIDLERGCF